MRAPRHRVHGRIREGEEGLFYYFAGSRGSRRRARGLAEDRLPGVVEVHEGFDKVKRFFMTLPGPEEVSEGSMGLLKTGSQVSSKSTKS